MTGLPEAPEHAIHSDIRPPHPASDNGSEESMNDYETGGAAEQADRHKLTEPRSSDRPKTGLDDPRAVDILTTEHWSLLSTRTLGY